MSNRIGTSFRPRVAAARHRSNKASRRTTTKFPVDSSTYPSPRSCSTNLNAVMTETPAAAPGRSGALSVDRRLARSRDGWPAAQRRRPPSAFRARRRASSVIAQRSDRHVPFLARTVLAASLLRHSPTRRAPPANPHHTPHRAVISTQASVRCTAIVSKVTPGATFAAIDLAPSDQVRRNVRQAQHSPQTSRAAVARQCTRRNGCGFRSQAAITARTSTAMYRKQRIGTPVRSVVALA
jgi:hypothetical protein